MKTNAAILWDTVGTGLSKRSTWTPRVRVRCWSPGRPPVCATPTNTSAPVTCPPAAVDRRPRGCGHRARGRTRRHGSGSRATTRRVVPAGLRSVPVLFDGAPEPLRSRRVDHGRQQVDGTFRRAGRGQDVGAWAFVGTFSQYGTVPDASVVKIDDDIRCPGMPAGLRGDHRLGFGGQNRDVRPATPSYLGSAASEAARSRARGWPAPSGSSWSKPVETKREKALRFGATHFVTDAGGSHALVADLTRGVMADSAIPQRRLWRLDDRGRHEHHPQGRRRGGHRTVDDGRQSADAGLMMFTLFQKRLLGSLYGEANPRADIPALLNCTATASCCSTRPSRTSTSWPRSTRATRTCVAGRNIRGVICTTTDKGRLAATSRKRVRHRNYAELSDSGPHVGTDQEFAQACHPVDEVLPLPKLATYGFQHVVGSTPAAVLVPILIANAIGLSSEETGHADHGRLFTCGIARSSRRSGSVTSASGCRAAGRHLRRRRADHRDRPGARRRHRQPALRLRCGDRRRCLHLLDRTGVRAAAQFFPPVVSGP